MGIRRLFLPGRYLRCRRIFRRPLLAHFRLAYVAKEPAPFSLTFLDGATWDAQPSKLMWDFWDRTLFGRGIEPPISMRDGMVEFSYRGQRKALRPGTVDYYIFTEIHDEDVYELAALPDVGVIVDLGGQAGLFASAAAKKAKRVISVEACSGNLAAFARNVEGSGLAERVTLVHRAIGRHSGQTVRLYYHPGNSGGHTTVAAMVSSFGTQQSPLQSEEVETLSLDDLFAQHGITSCDLLKCDVEGSEYEAFAGASDETLQRIQRIAAELHGADDTDRGQQVELQQRLRSLGFQLRLGDVVQASETRAWTRMLYAHRAGL